jgi:hypothetical protein
MSEAAAMMTTTTGGDIQHQIATPQLMPLETLDLMKAVPKTKKTTTRFRQLNLYQSQANSAFPKSQLMRTRSAHKLSRNHKWRPNRVLCFQPQRM